MRKLVFLLVLFCNICYSKDNKYGVTFEELLGCLGKIYEINDQSIRPRDSELYFEEDFFHYAFKGSLNSELNIPERKDTKFGQIYFASKLELFKVRLFCYYILLEISVENKNPSFRIARDCGDETTEFWLRFKRDNGELNFDNFDIISASKKKW